MSINRLYTSEQYLVTFSVEPHQQGIRLDQFLKERYRKRSREQIKRAIDNGKVFIRRNQGPHLSSGKPKPSSHLVSGDEITVLTEKKREPDVNFDYQILYEDEALFVINKPAQLPVHPAGSYFFNTLMVHLKTHGHRDPLRLEKEFFLVHRIDKETSGVLVLSKSKESCASLTRQFAERTTSKTYWAIVRGVCPEEFKVDLPLMRSNRSLIGLKMMTASLEEGGQSAFTAFRRIGVWGDFSMVECYPRTGRQHQIRVHLEAAGFPIVGDKLYGRPESESVQFYDRKYISAEMEASLILPRHALHAAHLSFSHPNTGKEMTFSAPLPDDLQDFLKRQKRHQQVVPHAQFFS